MNDAPHRIYCAGPLFNEPERREMQEIADAFKDAGYDTFLPQRDGLELTVCVEALTNQGLATVDAGRIISKAIFALDVYQVLTACDGIIVNLNGRVPDEGAVSEAALAWSDGKAIVGYQSDGRSVFCGEQNPLVAGLFDFCIYDEVSAAVEAMTLSFRKHSSHEARSAQRRQKMKDYLGLGESIWQALRRKASIDDLAKFLCTTSLCEHT